jgi:hypothetical protein
MVTVGQGVQKLGADQGPERVTFGRAITDVELIVQASGVGPPGPMGPQGYAVTVYDQATAPDPAGLRPGDEWIKRPPALSPQPIYLWTGTQWLPMYGETVTLNDLTGVTVTGETTGDIIRYNGTEFVNVPGISFYQAADADLTSIAALNSSANKMLYATAAQTWALTDISPVARTLISAGSVGAMRTYLDVWSKGEIGDPETNFVTIFNNGLLGSTL